MIQTMCSQCKKKSSLLKNYLINQQFLSIFFGYSINRTIKIPAIIFQIEPQPF